MKCYATVTAKLKQIITKLKNDVTQTGGGISDLGDISEEQYLGDIGVGI